MFVSLDLTILNGRSVGDPFGEFTSIQPKGNSVVDYLITSDSLTKDISIFKVGEFIPWLSDHCPIFHVLEINAALEAPPISTSRIPAPKRFIWTEMGIDKFKSTLFKDANKEKLNQYLSLYFSVVDSMTDLLINVADEAKIKTVSKKLNSTNDEDCTNLKKEIKALGRERKRLPKCEHILTKLSESKKKLKRRVKNNKIKYKDSIVKEMDLKNKVAKKFWKLFGKLDYKQGDEILKENIPIKKWKNYFQKTLKGAQYPEIEENLIKNHFSKNMFF